MPAADLPATCPSCGASVTHAKTALGDNVPLEKWTEPTGEDRYRIVEIGPPLIVARVSTSSMIDAYPDHRKDCPAYGNGLRR
jgi:hypothetical protein